MGIYIGGADEVGRGAFAGPLVASCVIFPEEFELTRPSDLIKDSKLLTEKKRQQAHTWITQNAISWGVGVATVKYINRAGIQSANKFALASAIRAATECRANDTKYILIDGLIRLNLGKIETRSQVDADATSFCVSAASILAKVYRDDYMRSLAMRRIYAKFLWQTNKGYGTKAHRECILKFGPTKEHRNLWISSMKGS